MIFSPDLLARFRVSYPRNKNQTFAFFAFTHEKFPAETHQSATFLLKSKIDLKVGINRGRIGTAS